MIPVYGLLVCVWKCFLWLLFSLHSSCDLPNTPETPFESAKTLGNHAIQIMPF